MRELKITEYENKFSKNGRVIKTTWPMLVENLQQIGHVKLYDKNYGSAIIGGATIDGRHKKTSIKQIDIMIFDCDHVTLKTLQDWLKLHFGGYTWFIYSTFSHCFWDGCFRIMIPAAKSIPVADYFDIWSNVDIPGKDPTTHDISRLAFLPSTPNGSGVMAKSAVTDQFFDFLDIPQPGRNSRITKLVGSWCNGKKIKKETLLKKAIATNNQRCNPPLPDEEIDTIVESIFAKEQEAREDGKTAYNDKKDTKSKFAVDLALQSIELFKGDGNEAIVKLDNSYYLVDSSVFESWLTKLYFDTFDDTIGRTSYNDAIHTLRGLALSKSETIKVFRRIGLNEETNTLIYYLGDQNYVHINNNSWRVIRGDSGNLCFVHENNFQAYNLPVYEDPENLWHLLRPFFNTSDDDFLLILCWLIGAFWPIGPFPILIKTGEQGSAKSTGSEFCVNIVDARKPSLIKPPKDSDNLYVSAHGRHVLGIDNLSFIDDTLSDDLCRIATGAGNEKRKLYTDTDTVSHSGARPQILNSVLSTIASRGDLLDRSIVVNYLPIDQYIAKDEMEKELNRRMPQIHGAIFTILVNVLKNLPGIRNDQIVSRMASFEKRIKSSSVAWSTHFIRCYSVNKISTEINYVTGDEVYEAIIQFFDQNEISSWKGLISDLVKKLNFRYESRYKDPKALGRHIERIKPNLRKVGILINKKRTKAGMAYLITFSGNNNNE